MSDFPVVSPVAAAVASAVGSAVTGSDSGRWYLHWGGVNEYAVHSAWAMSGFGDRIEFSFVADDPGNGTQKLLSGDDLTWYLRIDATTATLRFAFVRASDSGGVVIYGPTIVAGVIYEGHISYNADGVELVVNGVTYTSAHTPIVPQAGIIRIATATGGGDYFPGTIHYLRYVNATPLQGVNAVESDGVNLTATIPAITLDTATISFPFVYASGDQTILNGSVPILTIVSDLFVSGANVTALTVDGETATTLVDGQHYSVVVEVDGGTLTTVGQMAAGGIVGDITVVSGGVTYGPYDLSGDSGSTIPNAGTGGDGTWQNYDSGTDQVALPVLSRNYRMNDGPDALFLEDANHPLGPELVTNGGFDSDVSGWSLSSGTGPTWDAGELTAAAASSGLEVKPGQAVATEIGKQYSVVFEARVASGDLFYAAAGTYLGGLDVSGWVVAGATPTTNTQYAYVFTAVGTTTYLTFMGYNAGSIAEVWLDNVSVKCIETGAVLYNVDPEDWDRSKS